MKSLKLILVILIVSLTAYSQSISINNDGTAPNASAMLDIKSTTKGLLIPRMTTVQRTGIAAPAKGLLVYDTDNNSFWFYTGTAWNDLSAGGSNSSWIANGTHIYNSNTGNVGIGTNSPTEKLTVRTAGATYGLTQTDGITTVGTWIGTDAFFPGGWIGTKSNHPLNFFTAGSASKMTIFQTGDIVVGDNTVTPVGKFTVKTSNNADGISHLGDNGNILATRMGGTSAGIGTFSHTNMRIFANNYSAIFIAEATGNVGINTDDNNPLFKLDVAGRMRLRTQANGNSAGVWLNNPANTNTIAFMGIADAFTTGFYGNVAGWGLIMNVNTGNVGIGTLNPTEKLSVNGTVRSKEIIVEGGPWPDYVFDNNYILPGLDEVEKFIHQHNHLPNIPSAKEIEEKGQHVGEVQKRMMEKIEELTLYIIEQQKMIMQLKGQMETLNLKMNH